VGLTTSYKFDNQGAFLGGVHAVGCDSMTDENLLTDEKHSHRMEALALLGGLTYMKNRIGWDGTIHWHTDSESVIKTCAKINNGMKAGAWIKQKDKGLWEPLHKLLKLWGTRLKLQHVESHVDRKRDAQGNGA